MSENSEDERGEKISETLNKRFDTEQNPESDTNGESPESSKQRESDNKRNKGDKGNTPISKRGDTRSVSMWLPEQLVEEMQDVFKQTEFEFYQEYGGEPQKNRDLYPMLIAMGIEKARESELEEKVEHFQTKTE